MRFISSIDSLNYSEVGFVISNTDKAPEIGKGNSITKTTKNVYKSLNTKSGSYTLNEFSKIMPVRQNQTICILSR